jgi:ABC-2 type transport system permease protein
VTARSLGWAEAVRVVIVREARERTRTRGFRIGTAVMLLLAGGLAVLPHVLPDADDPEWTVALVGEEPEGLEDALGALGETDPAVVTLERTRLPPDEATRDDDVDAVLVDGRELVVEGRVPDRLVLLVSTALNQARLTDGLADLGTDPVRAAELLTPVPLAVRSLDGEDQEARETVAFLGAIALLLAIVTYGSWVQYSVLEEKSNRVVEIIVSAVQPSVLLAGKVVGIGAVALTQLGLIIATGMGVAALAGTLPDLPSFVPGAIGWTVLWFLLGFALYAVGYAAAGSLTARQEDAQSAAMPLVTVIMAAYFASIIVVGPEPASAAARVLSLFPLTAPIAMPTRLATGEVTAWEVATAVALLAATIAGVVTAAGRVYERALLRSEGRVQLRQVLRRQQG